MRTSRRFILPVIVSVAALVLSQGASCGNHPRHTAHLSLNAFAKGLQGVQAVELTLYNAGKVPPGAYDPANNICTGHACVKAGILKVATMADAAQTTLDAWQPGQPVPAVIGPVMQAAKTLMHNITTLIPMTPELQQQINATYDAIADILVLVSGG